MSDPAELLRRFRAGHAAVAERQRQLRAAEGPQSELAVRECQDAVRALIDMGAFPASRDPVSEQGVQEVRARWAAIQRGARAARAG